MIEEMNRNEYFKLCNLLLELKEVCDKHKLKELKYCGKVFTIEEDRELKIMM